MTIVGARPQFIKAAAVSRRINAAYADVIDEQIVHTGQHYDHNMSEVFFEELQIPKPALNLEIKGGSHGKSTGAMLAALEESMIASRPDGVMVYGDTNSTLAGALAAAKLHIPVFHVEAGLRSYNRKMPEEVNRILTDHISDLLFCPSQASRDILKGEGVEKGVHVVGDVMFDVVRHYGDALEGRDFGLKEPFALMTAHRAENTDDPARLGGILDGAAQTGMPIIFPIHPRTKNVLAQSGLALPDNVKAIEPLPYLDLLATLKACAVALTDSGGLQKEAFYMGKPCVTLRDETEWTELVDLGVNRVVGCDASAISQAVRDMTGAPMPEAAPYGDGDAAGRILDEIAGFLKA